MAAKTFVASSVRENVVGNRRQVTGKVLAVADADTLEVNELPEGIEFAIVTIEDLDAVAADTATATWSGKTITFQVTGASNDLRIVAQGRAANK